MAVKEYRCTSCSSQFKDEQDRDLNSLECPDCGSRALLRVDADDS